MWDGVTSVRSCANYYIPVEMSPFVEYRNGWWVVHEALPVDFWEEVDMGCKKKKGK